MSTAAHPLATPRKRAKRCTLGIDSKAPNEAETAAPLRDDGRNRGSSRSRRRARGGEVKDRPTRDGETPDDEADRRDGGGGVGSVALRVERAGRCGARRGVPAA